MNGLVYELGRELARTQALLTHVIRTANMQDTDTGKVVSEQLERNHRAMHHLAEQSAIDELGA